MIIRFKNRWPGVYRTIRRGLPGYSIDLGPPGMVYPGGSCFEPFSPTNALCMEPGNIFSKMTKETPHEIFEEIVRWNRGRIERIVSRGHATPEGEWYDQEQAEWVLLLKGRAKLTFEGGQTIELNPGDHLKIPSRSRHRVAWTDPAEETLWLAVHYDEEDQSGRSDEKTR